MWPPNETTFNVLFCIQDTVIKIFPCKKRHIFSIEERNYYLHNFQKKLDGYEFPVYSTKFCPRNQTEWNERSSAISCNESNGYLCLPNENITELLEFCYIHPFIWIQEG